MPLRNASDRFRVKNRQSEGQLAIRSFLSINSCTDAYIIPSNSLFRSLLPSFSLLLCQASEFHCRPIASHARISKQFTVSLSTTVPNTEPPKNRTD